MMNRGIAVLFGALAPLVLPTRAVPHHRQRDTDGYAGDRDQDFIYCHPVK